MPLVAPSPFGPAPGLQLRPRLASDGETYLAAWTDDREGSGSASYAARFRRDGTLLDPVGIRLESVAAPVAVGCGGGRCLVVGRELSYVLIDGDGKIVARSQLGGGFSPAIEVLFNGRDFIVLWSLGSVYVSTIDLDGRVVGVPSVVVPFRDSSNLRFQSAALDGSRIVAMYLDNDDLKVAVADSTGKAIANGTVVTSQFWNEDPFSAAVSLAYSNGVFVAIWRAFPSGDLLAQRFDDEGARIGHPFTVRGAVSFSFSITRDRDAFTISATENWPDTRVIAIPLSGEGVVGDASVTMAVPPLSVAVGDAAGDASGSRVAVWTAHPNEPGRESETWAAGGTAAPLLLSRAAAAQTNPKIAMGATSRLVAYEENRGAGMERPRTSIYATFMNSDGSSTFAVSPSALVQTRPDVAVAGDAYLVAWVEGTNLRGRIIRDGAPYGASLLIDDAAASPIVVASDGLDFIAAWWSVSTSSLRTMRISAFGAILGRGQDVRINALTGAPSPVLACSRSECLLAWRDLAVGPGPCEHFSCPTDERVKAVRLLPSLALRDSTPLILSANVPLFRGAVAAAGDGTYAVAWETLAGSAPIQAWAIDGNGVAGPTIERPGRLPSLVRQGDSWLLFRTVGFVEPDLAFTRFRSGASGADVELARDRQARTNAAAATAGNGVVVAYERTTRDEAAGGVPRIYLETIDPPKPKMRAAGR